MLNILQQLFSLFISDLEPDLEPPYILKSH